MIYGIPLWVFWAAGFAGMGAGSFILIAGDRARRWMRMYLLWQLKRLKRPLYRKLLRLNGWVLLVLGTLMVVLLSLSCRTSLAAI